MIPLLDYYSRVRTPHLHFPLLLFLHTLAEYVCSLFALEDSIPLSLHKKPTKLIVSPVEGPSPPQALPPPFPLSSLYFLSRARPCYAVTVPEPSDHAVVARPVSCTRLQRPSVTQPSVTPIVLRLRLVDVRRARFSLSPTVLDALA